MKDKIKIILNAADAVIPEWRNAKRTTLNTYCRVLITRELRKIKVTFMDIREIFGLQNHSTAVHYMTAYKEPIELSELNLKFQAELLRIRASIPRMYPCDSCMSQECGECEIKNCYKK